MWKIRYLKDEKLYEINYQYFISIYCSKRELQELLAELINALSSS